MKKTNIKHTKVEAGKREITEKEGCWPGEFFKFSEEDKAVLLEITRGFGLSPQYKTAESFFLKLLEDHCTSLLWMQDATNRGEHRENLIDIEKSFKKSLKCLNKMEHIYLPLANLRNMPNLALINYYSDAETEAQVLKGIKIAQENLDFLVKIIQKYKEPKRKKGAPQGYQTQFYIGVGKLLRRFFFNVPKFTAYQANGENRRRGGFFMELCGALRGIMGMSCEDPSRAIKAAIKSLS